ncbi:MAG: HDOD domain-containing protein [Bacteroidetes bacterium]|nr:HDOD domain-containing protein [Bacteroidota bacterium]MCW5895631.1 HDOD domain-containing protein [Bacteroidota bacterium]
MSEALTAGTSGCTPPSVVVIDDEPAILAAVTSLLRRQKLAVRTFDSAAEALNYLNLNPTNIIMSDMRMPDMTGSDLLTKAATINPDSIRIAMTGYEDKDVIFDAINNGIAQYYIFKPWDDDALRETITDAIRVQNELVSLRLKEGLKSLTALPSPTKFQTGLWEVLSNPDSTAHDLAQQIEGSPALVARLLRSANSVYFGSRHKISSVLDAIRIIGTANVAAMALAVESFGSICQCSKIELTAEIDHIWDQALRRAGLAKTIAASWNGFEQSHAINIAALLQEIGMVVQLCTKPEKYARYRASIADGTAPRHVVEREIFGVTHDVVGEAVLEFWNFPKFISSAVGRHHGNVQGDSVATILQIANVLDNEYDASPYDPSLNGLIDKWRTRIYN